MFVLFSFVFSFSILASPNLEELALSPKWLRLLHYKKTFTGGHESQADGDKFFLHPKGKTDPKLELLKSIEVFSSTSHPENNDAICMFPIRFKWLNQQLGNPWQVDQSRCHDYISFLSKVAAKRASIVFSSYFLSNPNSAFGHTLLRLSRYDDREETEMLDYAINYSAKTEASDPITYAFKGLTGFFKGEFASMPYYYKIHEYSNHEFRDLWSYDLNLNREQVLEMVGHIWELGHTYFDYFYFLENCSYHLLGIIEVVVPEKDLTGNYSVFAIPVDTIRLLKKEGLIKDGMYRRSTYSRLMEQSRGKSESDLQTAQAMVREPQKASRMVEGMEPQRAAGILDVGIEAFDYFNSVKILKNDLPTMELKSEILRARALNPVIGLPLQSERQLKDSPAEGHAPTRYTLSSGYVHDQGRETRLEARAALHDLLDPPRGSLKEGQLEVGRVTLNYKEKSYSKERMILQDLTIFSLKNFPTQTFWASPFSWQMEVGMRQLERRDCFDCPAPRIMGSLGNAFQLGEGKFLLALLLNGEFRLHPYFLDKYRAGLGPKIVGRYIFSEEWMLGLISHYHVFQDQELNAEIELRHHLNKKFSLTLQLKGLERENEWGREGLIGLQYFH